MAIIQKIHGLAGDNDTPNTESPVFEDLTLVSTGDSGSTRFWVQPSRDPYVGEIAQSFGTSVAGDQYQTDTCHVDEYGTRTDVRREHMLQEFDKDGDGVTSLHPTEGPDGNTQLANDTAKWNINGWHIENFSVDQVMSQLGG